MGALECFGRPGFLFMYAFFSVMDYFKEEQECKKEIILLKEKYKI